MSPYVPRDAVRQTDRVLARSVLLIVLALYSATFVGVPEVPGGEIAFQATRALGRTGGMGPGAAQPWIPPGAEPHARAGCSVGLAVVGLPLDWAGSLVSLAAPGLEEAHAADFYRERGSDYLAHLLVGWRNPLFGALTAWLVVLASRRLGVERRSAWWAGITYGLATFAWPQARSSLPDVQATCLLFFAFCLVLRTRGRFERLELPRPAELLGIGACLGLALMTRGSTLPAVLVIGAAAEVVLRRGHRALRASRWSPAGPIGSGGLRASVLVLAPLLGCVGALFALNAWLFGSPRGAGDGPLLGGLGAPTGSGLAGILLSPGRGLVWMAPLVLLAPVGFARLRATGERTTGRVALGVTLATLWAALGSGGWHGGWTYGPRLALPLLPFLWIGVAHAFDRAGGRTGRALATVLALAGAIVTLPGVLVDHTTHLDLAAQVAPVEWPDDTDDERFMRMQWDWGFAAPWAHWRILRHRVAGLPERYSADALFGVEGGGILAPSSGRLEGFRHLAWVDFAERLGGPGWLPVVLALALLAAGVGLALRALDPAAP